MSARTNAALGIVLVVISCAIPRTADAWKPRHHIATGNEAIRSLLAGHDSVTVDGRSYLVPQPVANAIRNHPDSYRAGCVGPDGFPDLLFGQTIVHPDWKADGGTYTHEWLRHLYDSGWAYYQAHNGDDVGQQALAFTYGYLTHAAGDLWGHTFINSFAGGSWPEIPGGDVRIAVRHVIVEGYVTERIPPSDMTLSVPYDFVYQAFIASPRALELARANTTPFGIPYFLKLRASLVASRDATDCDWYEPWDWLDCAKRAYLNAWIADIDDGLRAWPERMTRVGQHWFVDDEPGHMDAGMADLESFAYDHLLSMYGAPDFIGDFLSGWDAITEWVEGFLGIEIPGVGDLIVWIVEKQYGVDFDQLKEYFTNPTTYINTPPLFRTDTSERLDALLHTSGGTFDVERFAAHRNTVVLAKMVLLGPEQLNAILADHGTGALYGGVNPRVPRDMWDNAMLGFIRTLDGDHQWRRTPVGQPALVHSEGFPLWVDCHARERAFRVLFTDWETHATAGNFPDEGDACECWYDEPPSIAVTTNPAVLWPCDNKLVNVTADVTVRDDCDPNPTYVLLGIRCNEPVEGDGAGKHGADIQGADYGTADTRFDLRAERLGGGDGRVYTITYVAMDDAGNRDTTETTVCVPHRAMAGPLAGEADEASEAFAWFARPTPNPFTGTTRMSYRVPEGGAPVRLAVYDLAGREVRRLEDGFRSAGDHLLTWDGAGEGGAPVRSGVYFVRGLVGSRPLAWRVALVR